MATKINLNGINEQDIVGIINAAVANGVISFTIPIAYNVVTKTSDYSAVAGDFILVDSSGGVVNITIPLSSANDQKRISIKKISSDNNAVNVGRSGADTIDGQTTQSIYKQYVCMDLLAHSAASSWYIT
jgi:hypothetical protein